MDFLNEFNKIMNESGTFAMATSKENVPNVRIITFCSDENKNNVVYFPTYKKSPKTVEILENDNVAFTTIPNGHGGVVRVKNARVKKSELTVDDIKDGIIKKFAGFAGMAANAGHAMEVYEIYFDEAIVTVGHGNVGKVIF